MTVQNKTKFLEEFQSRFGEKVVAIELAQLMADDSVLGEFKLGKVKNPWGVIVITDSSVYFYKPAVSPALFSIPIANNSEEEEKDEIVKLSDLKELCFFKPKTAFFEKILIPESSRKLDVAFTDSNGRQCKFSFFLTNKVTQIMNFLPA